MKLGEWPRGYAGELNHQRPRIVRQRRQEMLARPALVYELAKPFAVFLDLVRVGRTLEFGDPIVPLDKFVAVAAYQQKIAYIPVIGNIAWRRVEEHTSELQSLMRILSAIICLN